MVILVLFLATIGAIAAWQMGRHRLAAKPWLEENASGDVPPIQTPMIPVQKIGLGVFLAVAGSLFALLFSAWSMQMHLAGVGMAGEMAEGGMAGWTPLPVPKVLWFNTMALILASAALQQAANASADGRLKEARAALAVAIITTTLFVTGQLWAWRQLAATGHFVTASQASAIFYLLTAMHGLHVLGGLIVLSRTTIRAWSPRPERALGSALNLSIELCAIYWHFLLLVWMVLFAMLVLA